MVAIRDCQTVAQPKYGAMIRSITGIDHDVTNKNAISYQRVKLTKNFFGSIFWGGIKSFSLLHLFPTFHRFSFLLTLSPSSPYKTHPHLWPLSLLLPLFTLFLNPSLPEAYIHGYTCAQGTISWEEAGFWGWTREEGLTCWMDERKVGWDMKGGRKPVCPQAITLHRTSQWLKDRMPSYKPYVLDDSLKQGLEY